MNVKDLNTLVEYHYWARNRVLEAVDALTPAQFTQELGGSFRSVRHTLGHIYGAEWIWHQRWLGQSPSSLPDAAQFETQAQIRAAWTELEAQVRALVSSLNEADAQKIYNYKTTDGTPLSTPFWAMLQHVVNHASYHRGQVTTLLRQLNAAPPKSMDMIGFYRERGA